MFAPGSTIGPYTLADKIGEGGMGEVYRATDTKLKRDVAIKFLSAAFTQEPDRLTRFQREAELLAQLQHPNIASIYGLEESEGHRALVMELVEGPTLAERMEAGALPVEEALGVAHQIAEALEEAHGKGIVHRDLKPANVKLTSEGRVKVLDFGLAKALDPAADLSGSGAQASLAHSPTLTANTQLGMILGTASYMSPEQARGVPIDKRADVWAFGVVLYEMLTGRRLFEGEMVSDVLAEVLKGSIDFEPLPPDTPAAIRRLLKRCLERKPKDRLHDIADARIVIQEVLAGDVEEAPAGRPTKEVARRRSPLLPWLIAGAAVVAAVAAALFSTGGREASGRRAYELSLSAPTGSQFRIGSNASWGSLSPDGSYVVVRLSGLEGTGLWLRSLDGADQRLLPGTEDGFYPFWSPDSRWVLFFVAGSLMRVEIAGGLPERVCAAPWGRGGDWSAASDRILFSPMGGGPVHVVDAGGGDPRPVTRVDADGGESAHYWPVWLPDGERFLYFVRATGSDRQGIYLGRVPAEGLDEERRRVVASSSSGLLAPPGPGRPPMLLWVEDDTLLARAFDVDTGTVVGPTSRVAGEVRVLESQRAAMFSASDEGTLSWASSRYGKLLLGWFDRSGAGPKPIDIPRLNLYQPTTSPDGRWVSFVVVDEGQGDIWVYDTLNGKARALTSTVAYDESVAWSPDSTELVFRTQGANDREVLRIPVDGSDAPARIDVDTVDGKRLEDSVTWLPNDWLVVSVEDADGTRDLYAVNLDDPSDSMPLFAVAGTGREARVSPNGQALAYLSDETGSQQAYVVSLSYEEGRPVIGRDRQRYPVDDVILQEWSLEGDELYGLTNGGDLHAVPVGFRGGRPLLGTPEYLFQLPPANSPAIGVAPKGERFLLSTDPESEYQSLSIVTGWGERLE